MMKKKRGVLSLNAVTGLLIMIVLLSALMDMVTLSNRYMSLHDTVKELSRTIAVQGGCLNDKPDGYPENYYNTLELSKLVSRSMKIGGFKPDEYKIFIDYTIFDDTATPDKKNKSYRKDFMYFKDGAITVEETDKIDYMHDFSVTIVAKYDWIFTRFLTGVPPARMSASAPNISEWKYNYDVWNGA